MFEASSVQSQTTSGAMASAGFAFSNAFSISGVMPAAPPRLAASRMSSLIVRRVAARGRIALQRTP